MRPGTGRETGLGHREPVERVAWAKGSSNRCHQATKDEGSPKGHLTGERHKDVQALIAEGPNASYGTKPLVHILCASKEK